MKKHFDLFISYFNIMDLAGPIHDFLLVFLGPGLILGGLGVVLLTNPIYSAFSFHFN